MKYEMTSPCPKCPFRTDIPGYLSRARVRGLERDLVGSQASFTCHQTTVPSEDGDSMVDGPNAQHCAGALILLERLEKPNQMMRIAERLRMYDFTKLDMKAPVFRSFAAMAKAQPS